MGSSAATSLAVAPQPGAGSGFADFVLSARVELYACLQLLAERARFITGAEWAAIALREEDQFVYRAVAGSAGPEIGSEASIHSTEASQSDQPRSAAKSLVVTVTRDSRTEAIFELFSGGLAFSDADCDSATRISGLVTTALDHMEAAERSEEAILSAKQRPKPEISLFWHAPDGGQQSLDPDSNPVDPAPGSSVRTCQTCGFPVSQGRTICFDCEVRLGKALPAPSLFDSERAPNWISVHGYTIASLLATALVAAIIYWLR
jgi:hypothetical protein